jgi:hypothetical protein
MSLSQCKKCFGYPLERILADYMALDRACFCYPPAEDITMLDEEDENPDEEV